MKKVVSVVLIASLLGAASVYAQNKCDAPAPAMDLDPLELRKQETVKWCWAASTQMVMDSHGQTEAQCFIIDETNRDDLDELGVSTCCGDNGQADGCFTAGWPGTPLKSFFYQYELRKVVEDGDAPPTWKEIAQEICQGRPFIFAMRWAGGGKHTFIVKGYAVETDGEQVLHVYDHVGNIFADVTYDQFLHGLQDGDQNYRDYLNVRPR